MAHIVVLGAGLGGAIMAYEMQEQLRPQDKITVVTKDPKYHFVPSNPWVAVNWRSQEDVEIDLAPVMKRLGIDFIVSPCESLDPAQNKMVLENGQTIEYDYLIIATGPELAFDEIEGLGPEGNTHSICHVDHAVTAGQAFDEFCKSPGPLIVGAVQGASCYGPAYEFAFILETELRRRKIRDQVQITYVTPEPYVGHLGLDGVGDTKGLLEGAMRDKHVKWMTNTKVNKVEPGLMSVETLNADGSSAGTSELQFKFAMMLPAFRGIKPLMGIEGLVNPRGFVIVDEHQMNPTFNNVFSVGVCVAIPPVGPTPLPVGVPKTGFMIESMVTATAMNIGQILRGNSPTHQGSWNAVCLADFGDSGIAFVAQPQIPPRNVNWSSEGKWVHMAKIGFEKYFMGKMRRGKSEPFYEKLAMDMLGINKLKEIKKD
ncbi:MAG TPA: NAD(P)/FAD-dependent oxidoreductase [Devosia sp.]|nr:NAD(P)/FAD-dependent oxidoreductase [Devosia sp.]